MKKLFIGSVLTIVIFACTEKSPDCGDPKSTNCEIVLVDSQNNTLVDTKYNQDSIQLNVNNSLIPLQFYNGMIIFNFAGFESHNGLNYILRLNQIDSDTLNIKIRKFTNQCWTSYSIDTFRYNNHILHSISENKYEVAK